MKDSKKYVVTSLSDMENINLRKNKFEVSINSKIINHEKFKGFFSRSNNGDSEVLFKILFNKYEIRVKSSKLFEFNFNEISKLKKIEGVLDVIQIN